MGQRLDLQTLLETLLGSENVYFQPPSGHVMQYPCIRYERTNIRSASADNSPYKLTKEYTIAVIDADPDSLIPDKIARLPQSIFDRGYAANNLNHSIFNVLY
jgi:hypothetical protein